MNDALATNVNTLLAGAKQDEAAGKRVSARSAFLPHITGQVSESRQKTNLAAQGFNFGSDVGPQAGAAGGGPNFPSMVTYNNFDARAKLRQTLFDYSAWQDYQGAKFGEKVAADQLAVAREQVATQTELDYVQALSAGARSLPRQANVKQAKPCSSWLAIRSMSAWPPAWMSPVHGRVWPATRLTWLNARPNSTRAEIQLARTAGLPLDSNLKLTDPLVFRPMPLGPVDTAINTAMADRPEIEVARTRIARGQHNLAVGAWPAPADGLG